MHVLENPKYTRINIQFEEEADKKLVCSQDGNKKIQHNL